MNGFNHNQIRHNHETAGEQLYATRQKQGLSIKKTAKKINIAPEYLEALERGDYEKLPEGVYKKKILKKYSSYLGIDYEKIKESFSKEREVTSQNKNKNLSVGKINERKFIIVPKIFKNSLIALLVIICFTYLGFCLNSIFSPPELTIINPAEAQISTDKKQITIKGKTNSEAKIYINNKNILKDNSGSFEELVNLKEGLNTITITAEKKYGKESKLKRKIMVE